MSNGSFGQNGLDLSQPQGTDSRQHSHTAHITLTVQFSNSTSLCVAGDKSIDLMAYLVNEKNDNATKLSHDFLSLPVR